ncbi:hypothetical protein [Sphingomonas psychrotolerans]|uniref:Uncharacterized protein n=1 Tax=Sphingomonas psychrotolerans TaxID=1327635 RepID=A0A2K8MFK0_9SPHN|nr:hypothetical protein [Sphingomonas psychrotolerans]ATY32655.1 hypothetical protein CVN68_12280 [Sphingomonas psychrotolerans]
MHETHQNVSTSWPTRHIIRAGGLFGVGFASSSDLLLVATHDGRGVIDCISGELVARDPNPSLPFDEHGRKVKGIGPIAGQEIIIAGEIYGGALSQVTDDGWRLEGQLSNSVDDVIRLITPVGTADEPGIFTGFVPEVRVFGFSPTGRSFVIGTGAEVFTFTR